MGLWHTDGRNSVSEQSTKSSECHGYICTKRGRVAACHTSGSLVSRKHSVTHQPALPSHASCFVYLHKLHLPVHLSHILDDTTIIIMGRFGKSYTRRHSYLHSMKGLTLDVNSISEFPSLSGGGTQSAQTPTPGQAIWSTINQRAAQQSLLQRQPQPPVASQAPSRASQTQSSQPSQSLPPRDDLFPSGSQFATQLDDFRNGGQGISGQLSGSTQPQTGNIEEFPPLGKNNPANMGQDRRESLIQVGSIGGFGGSIGFSNQSLQGQARGSVGSSLQARRDGTGISSPGPTTTGMRSLSKRPAETTHTDGSVSITIPHRPSSKWHRSRGKRWPHFFLRMDI